MQDKKWLWVMALALISISANFWGFPIYILDESKNAACAMEMLQRGDWVTPTFNGQLRTDKPPLHYYFMMASYTVFGVTPFAARLFSVIMGLLTVASVYYFTRRMEGEQAAFFSGLVMASSLFVAVEFHLAVPDPYFIFFLTLCWLSFAYALHTERDQFLYVSYAAMALAFLAKGPAAVVLSGLILPAYLFLRKGFSAAVIWRARPVHALVIFLVIASPWWIAVGMATDGAWLQSFFWGHNVGRFLAPFEDHSNIPGMAILVLLVALLPMAVLLPVAMFHGWKERTLHPLALLALVAVIGVILFFSLSRTFLPNYIGPAVPFGAILIGYAMDRMLRQARAIAGFTKVISILLVLVMAILVLVFRQVVSQDKWISDMPDLAWLFLPWPMGALLAAWFIRQNNLRHALVTWLASFWLTGVLLFYAGVPRILARNPVEASISTIREADREIIGYRFFNPAYIFALQRPLLTYWTAEDVRNYAAGRKVMVLSREDYEAELVGAGFKVIFRQPYLFEGSTALILVNTP